jgi:hypothetical protein
MPLLVVSKHVYVEQSPQSIICTPAQQRGSLPERCGRRSKRKGLVPTRLAQEYPTELVAFDCAGSGLLPGAGG